MAKRAYETLAVAHHRKLRGLTTITLDRPEKLLYVYCVDADAKDHDFLAVIDVDLESPKYGQLVYQRLLERGPRFGSRDQRSEVGELADDVGVPKLPKHRDDHQVADSEAALEPLLVAKRVRQVAKASFQELDNLRAPLMSRSKSSGTRSSEKRGSGTEMLIAATTRALTSMTGAARQLTPMVDSP